MALHSIECNAMQLIICAYDSASLQQQAFINGVLISYVTRLLSENKLPETGKELTTGTVYLLKSIVRLYGYYAVSKVKSIRSLQRHCQYLPAAQ